MVEVMLIFGLTAFIYYILMAYKTSSKFKEAGKKIPVRTSLYLPYYITKMSRGNLPDFKNMPQGRLVRNLKTIAKYDIFLVVYLEIVNSHTEGSTRLTHKEVVSKELRGDYIGFLSKWLSRNSVI